MHSTSPVGVRRVQLHAYQPPALVRTLRTAIGPEVTLVKVLHLREGRCLEGPPVPAYGRAGTDPFLLDAVTEDGRIGSTGRQAGALSADHPSSALLRCRRRHRGPRHLGHCDPSAVSALARLWRARSLEESA
ncbi:hypothetical protein [Kitasatospora kifunensis]|uniref:Phosphoribosylanthranilate isomerase n=1 Tax=Kitasatospora kifunensis TaxID=58351 RepID=A0A7W7RB93_KITKI|nr:hypothetical protein [Kitasatospora kifunensis]MBB4928840.1 phosphoribosylanthranilate isomerase [Kitasatospora kifunensis]